MRPIRELGSRRGGRAARITPVMQIHVVDCVVSEENKSIRKNKYIDRMISEGPEEVTKTNKLLLSASEEWRQRPSRNMCFRHHQMSET